MVWMGVGVAGKGSPAETRLQNHPQGGSDEDKEAEGEGKAGGVRLIEKINQNIYKERIFFDLWWNVDMKDLEKNVTEKLGAIQNGVFCIIKIKKKM